MITSIVSGKVYKGSDTFSLDEGVRGRVLCRDDSMLVRVGEDGTEHVESIGKVHNVLCFEACEYRLITDKTNTWYMVYSHPQDRKETLDLTPVEFKVDDREVTTEEKMKMFVKQLFLEKYSQDIDEDDMDDEDDFSIPEEEEIFTDYEVEANQILKANADLMVEKAKQSEKEASVDDTETSHSTDEPIGDPDPKSE